MGYSNIYSIVSCKLRGYFSSILALTWTFGLSLLLISTSHADKIIRIQNGSEDLVLNADNFDILEDTTQKLTIEEVSKSPHSKFLPDTANIWFNKNPKAIYWLRFTVSKINNGFYRYFLETYAPHTNSIQVYIPSKDGKFLCQKGGEDLPFHNRNYKTKNIVFDLPLPENSSPTTFYIRIESKNFSAFDYRIKTLNYFLYYITTEYFFLGIYYGVLLIMLIYNLMVYFSVREKVYLYYMLYVASSALITMTDDGLGFQYLWPSFPHWTRTIGYTIAPLVFLIAFVVYSSSFLELNKRFSLYWKITTGSLLVYLFYFGIMLLTVGSASPIVYTLPFLIIYCISFLCYKKGYNAARFFILGFTFIFISIVIVQLRAEHILGGNFFTVYTLNIGLLLEAVIFSFALSDRIRLIKLENELNQQKIIESLNINKDLQEKVNRELEEKVIERTTELRLKNNELEEINSKLAELNSTIQNMNVQLDYDNWYLKKDLKEDLQARILENEVSYEEFSTIFPTELSCLRYLADLKWNKFFRCKKCGNLKFTDSHDHTDRKCTVCGFLESPTAFTLYHGVRFPLTKAFYLTYLFYKKTNGRNLSDLADKLEIRRNTCGKFRGKVEERITEFKLKHKKNYIGSWEEIILAK